MSDEVLPVTASDNEWRRQAGAGGASSISRVTALVFGGFIIVLLVGAIIGLVMLLGKRELPYVVTMAIDEPNDEYVAMIREDAKLLRGALTVKDLETSKDQETFEDASDYKERQQFKSKLDAIQEGRLLQAWSTSSTLKQERPFLFLVSGLADVNEKGQIALLLNRGGMVTLDEILDALGKCPSKKKLLLLDIAHPRANLFKGRYKEDVAGALDKYLSQRVASGELPCHVITSTSLEGEISEVIPSLKKTVFMHYLIEGLNGWADKANPASIADKRVTVRELGDFLKVRVNRYVFQNRQRSQTPKLYEQTSEKTNDFALMVDVNPVHAKEKDAEGKEVLAQPKFAWPARPETAIAAWKQKPTDPALLARYESLLILAEQRFLARESFPAIELPGKADGVPVVRREPIVVPTLRAAEAKLPPVPMTDPKENPVAKLKDALNLPKEKKEDRNRRIEEVLQAFKETKAEARAQLAVWDWLMVRKGTLTTEDLNDALGIWNQLSGGLNTVATLEEKMIRSILKFKSDPIFTLATNIRGNLEEYVRVQLELTDSMSKWLLAEPRGSAAISNESVEEFFNAWDRTREYLFEPKRVNDFPTDFEQAVTRLKDLQLLLTQTWTKSRTERIVQGETDAKARRYFMQTALACAEKNYPSVDVWEKLAGPGDRTASIQAISKLVDPKEIAKRLASLKNIVSVNDLEKQKDTIEQIEALLLMPMVGEDERSKLIAERNRLAEISHVRTWESDVDDDNAKSWNPKANLNPKPNDAPDRRRKVATKLLSFVGRKPDPKDEFEKWQKDPAAKDFPVGLTPKEKPRSTPGNEEDDADFKAYSAIVARISKIIGTPAP